MTRLSIGVASVIATVVAVACGSGGGKASIDGDTGGRGSGGRGSGASGGGSGLIVLDGGAATGNSSNGGRGGFDPDAACVTDAADGEPVPVDLYFMVDISGSMNCPVPDANNCEIDPGPPYAPTTRWTVESAALQDFMSSAENAGLGVGIGFFPATSGSCEPRSYARAAVEIAALPGAASMLNAVIDRQNPAGNTPTVPSLTGATQHATAWADQNPGHSVAVVYVTDGYPRGCDGSNTMTNAARVAQNAFSATPSIRTYVLGVGPNLSELNQIAASGGTERAFLIDTSANAAAQLAAALDTIRNDVALDCTYTIPAPPTGQQLDYDRVNVRYTSGSGDVTDIARDPSVSDCIDGWQYSTDRSQINLCGELCDAVQADTGGRVEILFGCTTVINPPR